MLVQKKKGFYTEQPQVKHSSFITGWWHVLVIPNIHRLHDMEFTRMKLVNICKKSKFKLEI